MIVHLIKKQRIILIALIITPAYLLAQSADSWSGDYTINTVNGTALDTIRIAKIKNILKDVVSSRFESDLERWRIYSLSKEDTVDLIARRFLYDIKHKENEYEALQWTGMYKRGEIKCLDAGNFFLCNCNPKTKINLGKESFFSKTGWFGVRLHYGLFELKKIK